MMLMVVIIMTDNGKASVCFDHDTHFVVSSSPFTLPPCLVFLSCLISCRCDSVVVVLVVVWCKKLVVVVVASDVVVVFRPLGRGKKKE